MFNDLEWLIKLQQLDNKIYLLTGEQRNSEDRINSLKLNLEEISITKIKLNRELKKQIRKKERLLSDIEDQKRILEQKREDLQNDKKTKKEHIRREITKLEVAVEVFTEKSKVLTQKIADTEKTISEKDGKINEVEKLIKNEEKNVNKLEKNSAGDLDKLIEEREDIKGKIREPFFRHYERIMRIRNGMAITFVDEKGLCDGCKIHIPYQFQQKIKKMDDYNVCEGCGRILVDKEYVNNDDE